MELTSENIFKLNEGRIIFNDPVGSTYHNYDDKNTDFDFLIDRDISKHSTYGIIISRNPQSWFEFEIFQKSTIYAYGAYYSDSAGSSPGYFDLYIERDNKFVVYKKHIQTHNGWHVLFKSLPKGRYKVETDDCYCCFSEWFVQRLQEPRYLIKQNNNYYITNELIAIKASGNPSDIIDLYKKYGFNDLNILLKTFNKKSVLLNYNKENNLYKTEQEIDFNKIKSNIYLKETEENKFIEYDTEPYNMIDIIKEKIGNEFYITKYIK